MSVFQVSSIKWIVITVPKLTLPNLCIANVVLSMSVSTPMDVTMITLTRESRILLA